MLHTFVFMYSDYITCHVAIYYAVRMYNICMYIQELRSLPAVPGPQALPRRRGQEVRIMNDHNYDHFANTPVYDYLHILLIFYICS